MPSPSRGPDIKSRRKIDFAEKTITEKIVGCDARNFSDDRPAP